MVSDDINSVGFTELLDSMIKQYDTIITMTLSWVPLNPVRLKLRLCCSWSTLFVNATVVDW